MRAQQPRYLIDSMLPNWSQLIWRFWLDFWTKSISLFSATYFWNMFGIFLCVYLGMFLLTLPLLLFLWLWNQVQNFMIFFAITRDVMLLVTISLVENFNKVHWLINLNILPINYFLCNFTTFFTTFLVVFMAGKFQIWTYLLNLVEDLCLIFGNVAVLKYVSWMSSRNFFTHKCFASIEFA